jgi:hypothetical protein
MTAFFVVLALIGVIGGSVARRRTMERAVLARAARAQSASSWLLDPRLLSVGLQAGRSLGWQRLVPIALVGFLAAQWARENRNRRGAQHDTA